MPRFRLQRPTDQPTGKDRLLGRLKIALACADFNELYVVVAFARVGPLQRLLAEIMAWRAAGKTIHAVFGIDDGITSIEAIEFGLQHFNELRIAHQPGQFAPTFHPKIYALAGATRALAFIGSNNLTTGGLETNFETCIELDMALPSEKGAWDDVKACVDDASGAGIVANAGILKQLVDGGAVRSERERDVREGRGGYISSFKSTKPSLPAFPAINFKPPSAIPGASRSVKPVAPTSPRQRKAAASATTSSGPTSAPVSFVAQALVMQISPHKNGEVFLSMLAVNQNPAFIGFPFTGTSAPKKSKNPPYPQRDPDPLVNITVFDAQGVAVASLQSYALNLVYYEKKKEIRMTVQTGVANQIPDRSILVMRQGGQGVDYTMDIYSPGGASYQSYLAVCNQEMPSGGKPNPRKFGWL